MWLQSVWPADCFVGYVTLIWVRPFIPRQEIIVWQQNGQTRIDTKEHTAPLRHRGGRSSVIRCTVIHNCQRKSGVSHWRIEQHTNASVEQITQRSGFKTAICRCIHMLAMSREVVCLSCSVTGRGSEYVNHFQFMDGHCIINIVRIVVSSNE